MNFKMMTGVPPLEPSDIRVSNSKSLILKHGRTARQEHLGNELQDIIMVKQAGLRLKNLNNIEYCRSLKICILANNYITKIEALSNCHELVKLDLHGNQITQLPGSYFWDGMKNLQFLNLHDNAIGNNIQFLSSCQSLIGLTLYDTPLSLRESYRHCTINSIWSLKALDNYVISDEEIIENWCLPQKFKAQTPNLFVDLCPVTEMESFTDEMKMVKDIISKINYILAFYSPVLIIQRWIRGHLTRKRLGKVSWDLRLPQRSHVMSKVTSSPSLGSRNRFLEQTGFKRNRRTSPTPTKQYEFCIPSCGSEKNIAIDLEKLLQSDIVQAKKSEKESYSLNSESNLKLNTPYCTPVQSRLFEYSKTKPKRNKGESDSEKYDLDDLGFRLPGSKVFFHKADPVSEMLISHRENGREIRFAIDQFHSASQEAAAKPKINYCPPVSMEKRLIARSYASISLTPFQVIEKAYRDRQKAENQNLKADWVAQARVTRVEAQNHIRGYLETRNSNALNKSEKDSLQLQEAMERHKTNDSKLIQLARQRHARFLEEKKQRAAENAQVKDFSAQHISISNTMLKYKMQERKYALRQEKTDLVMTCKLKQEERMQLVHKYMEHRKFAIETEAHFEKMAIDNRLVQQANDHLQQVRAKVASQRPHRAAMVAMQPIPVDQVPI
ncbi:leucine-rich repeat and IQ domain-containing protein 3 [Polyodon spathula]|uniref:leucine-rich repeat and IQ domain-containing protein 3 n=1 Tax=Polyodon spathula TaxID=7913 RepID=UPI001B7EED23|nr:leucine-rich repeat and IQ domain-containing protein 3 [Polyodon spathula]